MVKNAFCRVTVVELFAQVCYQWSTNVCFNIEYFGFSKINSRKRALTRICTISIILLFWQMFQPCFVRTTDGDILTSTVNADARVRMRVNVSPWSHVNLSKFIQSVSERTHTYKQLLIYLTLVLRISEVCTECTQANLFVSGFAEVCGHTCRCNAVELYLQ